MADKVYGGTPMSGRPLCESCSYGHVKRGYNFQEEVRCNQNYGKLVLFSVMSCSLYEPRSTASLAEMKKVAWIVESRNRGTWGFSGKKETEIVVRPPGESTDVLT